MTVENIVRQIAPVAETNELDMLRRQLAAAQERIATLQTRSASKLSAKVTEKGGMSVYGLGRFPVTLYRQQWERLFAHADLLKAFMVENAAMLSTKD